MCVKWPNILCFSVRTFVCVCVSVCWYVCIRACARVCVCVCHGCTYHNYCLLQFILVRCDKNDDMKLTWDEFYNTLKAYVD